MLFFFMLMLFRASMFTLSSKNTVLYVSIVQYYTIQLYSHSDNKENLIKCLFTKVITVEWNIVRHSKLTLTRAIAPLYFHFFLKF